MLRPYEHYILKYNWKEMALEYLLYTPLWKENVLRSFYLRVLYSKFMLAQFILGAQEM
jgi:hypothetical protein